MSSSSFGTNAGNDSVAASLKMQEIVSRRIVWSSERLFHTGFAVAIAAAVLLGFSRTFFFRPWFREWAEAHGSPEPFFYFHGVLFFAWLMLLVVQSSLVASRRVDVHRRLGGVGAGLAFAMIVVGIVGALIAARRPTGFMDVPVPPLQFLVVPVSNIVMFATCVTLALIKRRNAQSHKRFMLLAAIALVEAGVARWPLAMMTMQLPLPGFTMTEVFVDLFLIPMVVWDIVSRGRLHPVTLWGGLALIASQPLRFLLSGTDTWMAFAAWAVGLLG